MEVATATVGTGVVPVFRDEKGALQAVVVRPGTHYKSKNYKADPDSPYTMIAGGFINLTTTEGVPGIFEARADKAEHPREGAVREMFEEIKDDQGNSLLVPNPERLKPLDTKTITFAVTGEKRVVIGFAFEMNAKEIEVIKAHVERVRNEPGYRRACRVHTINPMSGEPEVCQVDILSLEEIAHSNHTLLHPDQLSLFRLAYEEYSILASKV